MAQKIKINRLIGRKLLQEWFLNNWHSYSLDLMEDYFTYSATYAINEVIF